MTTEIEQQIVSINEASRRFRSTSILLGASSEPALEAWNRYKKRLARLIRMEGYRPELLDRVENPLEAGAE